MKKLDYKELGEEIKNVFLNQNKFQMNKHVPTFEIDGKYVGDFFNFTMFETVEGSVPLFYHVYSPYDIISGETSQYAVVLKSALPILETEFSEYVRQRTGVMTALVAKALKLSPQKILFVGTGKIARCDLEALKKYYPEIDQVWFVNTTGLAKEFDATARSLGVEATPTSLDDIGSFDLIVCHTNSKVPLLTAAMRERIKQGALITTFVSEDFMEVDESFYDTNEATVVADWDGTIDEAPELASAIKNGLTDRRRIIYLDKLLTQPTLPDRRYVIYRSHGTPMQNLAALKLLMKKTQ